ncbi:MAG: hypothetical protein K6G09_04375 [Treponema sp.]|nr:hypothetical protein [Treponema sp.]
MSLFKKLTISKNDAAKTVIAIYVPNPESKECFKLEKTDSSTPKVVLQEFSFESKEQLIAFREALNKLVL